MASRGGRGGGFGRRGGGAGGGSNTRALLARAALEVGLDDRTPQLTLEAITHPPLYPDLMWHSSGRQGHHQWSNSPPAVPSSSLSSSAADPSAIRIAIPSTAQSAVLDLSASPPPPPTPALSNPKRPTSVVNLINKHREVLQAFEESAQHLNVSSTDSVVDVPRWLPHRDDDDDTEPSTPRGRGRQKPDVRVLATLGKLGTDPRYFPVELLPSHDPPRQRQPSRRQPLKRKLTDGSSTWRNSTKSTRWEELAQRETTTVVDGAGAEAAEELDVATGARIKSGKAADTDERDDDDEDAADDLPGNEDEEDLEDYTKDYYESEGESDGGDAEATF